jgi:hypothetical protein
MLLQPQNRDILIDVSFRFLSWISKNFPSIVDDIRDSSFGSLGELVREYPTSFWGKVGYRDYSVLSLPSKTDKKTILEKIAYIIVNSEEEVINEILVGFVEAHMFSRPESPLAEELGAMIGRDLSGLC